MEFPCMLFIAFPLLLLIFSLLSLIFVILITMCLGVFLDSLHFLDLSDCFLSQVKEYFSYYLFKYFLRLFLSVFSFWDLFNANISVLDVVPEAFETVLISFHSFFLFSVQWQ